MNEKTYTAKTKLPWIFDWQFIILMQLLFNIAIITDFSIIRQLFSFVYLTLIVGFIPAKLLNIDDFGTGKLLLFSTGLSISVVMFIGLLINELFRIFGFPNPLSVHSLLIGLNCFTFLGYLLSHFKKKKRLKIRNDNVSPWILLPIALLSLSIYGSFIVNHEGDNFLLLFSIIIICIVAVVSVLWLTRKPKFGFAPLILFTIAFSLFLQYPLITNYVLGNDIYEEFYVFSMTKNKQYWNSSFTSELTSYGRVNAMLSVTLLPTIYSELLGIDGNIIFKFLYPYILSWIVLGIYELYLTLFDKKLSFLATFFYTTNNVVFWLFSCRQIVAELFYILLFILIIDKNFKSYNKKICYFVFGAALVVSHYSMAYIFMFVALFMWFYEFLLKRNLRSIKISQILIIFVLSFAWYIFVSSASSFKDFLNTIDYIYRNFLNDFFRPEAREGQVIAALGGGEIYSLWNVFGRFLFHVSEAFIVIGLVKLSIDWFKGKKLSAAYVAAVLVNFMIILMCIVLPNFSRALQISRFYQITLLLLSPLCIIGGKTIMSLMSKRRRYMYALFLICLFQVPFFLFQSGFIYVITGSPTWSIPLSYRKGDFSNPHLYNQVVYEQEVLAAEWLRHKGDLDVKYENLIYADLLMLDHVLTAYGLFPPEVKRILTNTTILNEGSYVYMGRLNVVKGVFGGYKGTIVWNANNLSFTSELLNKVYSNGASQVYYCNNFQ